MSAMATMAPSRAKRRTIARPMPVAPPVTRAILFSSRIVIPLTCACLFTLHFPQQRQTLVYDLACGIRAEWCDLDLIATQLVSIGSGNVRPADIGITGKQRMFKGRCTLDA